LPYQFWTIANMTIWGKSFVIQQYKNVPSRKRFTKLPTSVANLMANVIWNLVRNSIHISCAGQGVTNLSWWIYNPSDEFFSPWPFQWTFIHQRIKNTMNFQLSGWSEVIINGDNIRR
jgi:hypothetical protein